MSLLRTLERLRVQRSPTNEAEVKAFIVSPILNALGWPSDDSRCVSYDYPVSTRPTRRVDIALHADDRSPIAFLDLEAPGTSLDNQLLHLSNSEYYAGPRICVLTNGREWRFYLPFAKGKPTQNCFCRFRLVETGDRSSSTVAIGDKFQKYMSRHALLSQSAEKDAEAALVAVRERHMLNNRIHEIWKRMTSDPDRDLVVLIQKRIQEETGISVDEYPVKLALAGYVPFPEGPSSANDTRQDAIETRRVSGRNAVTGKKPIGFVLFGHEYRVSNNCDVLVKVAEILYRRRPDDFGLQIKGLWGNNMAWISRDPYVLGVARSIGSSSYYIDIRLNVRDQAQRWCRLLKAFGYAPDDLELIYRG